MQIRSVAFSLLLTLVLAAGAGCLGFLAGRQTADGPGAYERGAREGERLARGQARAEFGQGGSAYAAILARGERRGFARGRRAGEAQGRRRGAVAARDATFAGFPGGWQIGAWYLVNVAPGTDGERYAIGGRLRALRGRLYSVCAGGQRVCAQPLTEPGARETARAPASAAAN
jgi:hypothetical protein